MQKEDRSVGMYNLVEQWQQSGKSQKQFCAEQSIKLATFGYWVKKYRSNKQGDTGFARVDIGRNALQSTSARIEIDLADGMVIRIY